MRAGTVGWIAHVVGTGIAVVTDRGAHANAAEAGIVRGAQAPVVARVPGSGNMSATILVGVGVAGIANIVRAWVAVVAVIHLTTAAHAVGAEFTKRTRIPIVAGVVVEYVLTTDPRQTAIVRAYV